MPKISIMRLLIAAVLVGTCSIVGLWSAILSMDMAEKLNRKLPPNKQFGSLFWGPIKRLRFLEEYERAFPDDPMKKRVWLLWTIMFASLVGVAFDLILFR